MNFPIEQVRQLKRTVFNNNVRSQTPLPVWILTFQKTDDLKDKLDSLTSLFCIRIHLDVYKGPAGVTQCYRCQEFGHLAAYCRKEEKCVRCSGNHKVSACTQNVTLKCANCRGQHPARFRQCPEYQKVIEKTQRTTVRQPSRTFPPIDPNRPAWNTNGPTRNNNDNTEFPPLQPRQNRSVPDRQTEDVNGTSLTQLIELLTNPTILPHLQTLLEFTRQIAEKPDLINNIKLLLTITQSNMP